MIISRAAEAELLVLPAGLGKGHMPLGARAFHGDTARRVPGVLLWLAPCRNHGG